MKVMTLCSASALTSTESRTSLTLTYPLTLNVEMQSNSMMTISTLWLAAVMRFGCSCMQLPGAITAT